MALAASIDQQPNRQTVNGHIARNTRITSGAITMDASYATGGEAITAADVGMKRAIDRIIIESEDGYILKFDKLNSKIMAYYADNDAGADGALIQVAAAVDLSGVVAGYIAIGQ
jgi:hypothetical protein